MIAIRHIIAVLRESHVMTILYKIHQLLDRCLEEELDSEAHRDVQRSDGCEGTHDLALKQLWQDRLLTSASKWMTSPAILSGDRDPSRTTRRGPDG